MAEQIIVTLREAAEILHRPVNSLRAWLYNGDHISPACKDGNSVRYFLDDLRGVSQKHRDNREDAKVFAARRALDAMMLDVMAGENPAGPMKRARRDVTERGIP